MYVAELEAPIRIPTWIDDLESFRRWADSDDFPDEGRIESIGGEVWIDMSKEQLFAHNQVKHEFSMALGQFVKRNRLGRYFPDGARLSEVTADISKQPDGIFVPGTSFASGRVRLVPRRRGGIVELDGSPDMVLEIVSRGSVRKDNIILRERYWLAQVSEYWLVDARAKDIRFDILRYAPKGYVASRKQAGWVHSAVFELSFRLSVAADERGDPEYTLDVR